MVAGAYVTDIVAQACATDVLTLVIASGFWI